jgi:hypothetical protein
MACKAVRDSRGRHSLRVQQCACAARRRAFRRHRRASRRYICVRLRGEPSTAEERRVGEEGVVGEEDVVGEEKERRARGTHATQQRTRRGHVTYDVIVPSRAPASSLVLRLLHHVPCEYGPRGVPLAASVNDGLGRLHRPPPYSHILPRSETNRVFCVTGRHHVHRSPYTRADIGNNDFMLVPCITWDYLRTG